MTSLSGNSTLTTLGTLLILHATYSCLHYRSLAIAADLPDTSTPPLDVVMEVYAGFGLCLVGQLMCGPFHRVRIVVVNNNNNKGGKGGDSSSSRFLGEIPTTGGSTSGGSCQRKVEIVAPAYRTRDFDLFNTRGRALSMVMQQRSGKHNMTS